ncbi:hypothetical protein [Allosphingosinicella deserti]|uniref:Uncharacterized protein n=1 Tax=Allosphingosinicella deserti TaxID=2116704 RepID=A0A2P7QN76_9SPHN|nr:hypothetical protein [Sphingomonas deserti]PSJ39412.1 hypothetical protein C7I55_12400 [Sphingomonas deserti]
MPVLMTIALLVVGVTGVCVAALLAGIHKRQNRFNQTQLDAVGRETAEKAAHYATHVERLEHRVRILEGIAADRGIAVSDEIETVSKALLN